MKFVFVCQFRHFVLLILFSIISIFAYVIHYETYVTILTERIALIITILITHTPVIKATTQDDLADGMTRRIQK